MSSESRSWHRRRLAAAIVLCLLSGCTAAQATDWSSYTPVARWGQASTVAGWTFLLHGGKTGGAGTFASAANTADLLALDLSSTVSLSNPAWQIHTADPASPPVAYHTFEALGPWALVFGGQNTVVALPSGNDSSALLSLSNPFSLSSTAAWTAEPAKWAGQPMRRIRHASVTSGGTQWTFGGLKADGSGIAFAELWTFTDSTWSLVVPSSATSPPATYDATLSIVTVDGATSLILIGGVDPAASPTSLAPMTTIWLFDVVSSEWSSIAATGVAPSARRGHVALELDSSRILIHGGASGDATAVYSDMAILTVSSDGSSAAWVAVSGSGTAPSGRWSHSAALVGTNALFVFGYGVTAPVDAGLYAFDTTTSAWVTSLAAVSAPPAFSPPSQTTQKTRPATGATLPSPVISTSAGSSALPSDADSHPATTVIVASTVGGAVLVAAAGAAVFLARKRRRRNHFAADDEGFDGPDTALMRERKSHSAFDIARRVLGTRAGGASGGMPFPATPRRFDMLEDEESVWSGGRTPSVGSRRVASGGSGGLVDSTRSVLGASASFVGGLLAGGGSANKRRRTATYDDDDDAWDDAQALYTDADLGADFDAAVRGRTESPPLPPPSRVSFLSPSSSLFGSTFSPNASGPNTPTQFEQLRRSGTWWARFTAGTSALVGPTAQYAIRDPTPAPDPFADPLPTSSSQGTMLAESADSHSTNATTASPGDSRSKRSSRHDLDAITEHGLGGHLADEGSLSTLASATSSAMNEERMREMHVAQRLRTTSGERSASGGADPFADTPGLETPGSIIWDGGRIEPRGTSRIDAAAYTDDESTPLVSSPMSDGPPMTFESFMAATNSAAPASPSGHRRTPTGGNTGVRAMVQEFERRSTLEVSPPLAPSAVLPSSPRKARRPPVAVEHGLVRKPQLFVANPDSM